ncbi:cyanophycinase [Paenibacillus sp. GCM10023252]|uniref:cyanophycinase n=1 Tax=Paenibacillus sp. GCM10023252 TaxID=3252649 RepID=UPI0036129844
MNEYTNAVPPITVGSGSGTGTWLVGGGTTSGSELGLADSPFLHALRGVVSATQDERPRIAVFSPGTAEAVRHHYYDYDGYSLEQEYADYGFEAVFIPLAIDNYKEYADSSYWANQVRSCQAVFLQGGDQARHARQLLNDDGTLSKLAQAIRDVYEAGGVVAGTSAGAHVQSSPVFGFGDSYPAMVYNQAETIQTPAELLVDDIHTPKLPGNNMIIPGLGFAREGFIYDTHFDARGRLGRLLVGLRDTGARAGIGLDEGTGLLIRGSTGTVVGHNGVFVIESEGASYGPRGSGETFRAEGVRISYLTSGDQIDLDTFAITPAEHKLPVVTRADQESFDSMDLFSRGELKYQTTAVILSLMHSAADSVQAGVHKHGISYGPDYVVTFRKDAQTLGFESGEGYTTGNHQAVTALRGFKKTTVVRMLVDVAAFR